MLVPLLALFFFLHNPMCANAEEYLGQDYASVTRFTTHYGFADTSKPAPTQNWVLCCDNPKSKVFIIAQERPHYDSGRSYCQVDYFVLGEPCTVTIYRDGKFILTNEDKPVDLSLLKSKPTCTMFPVSAGGPVYSDNEIRQRPLVSAGMGSFPVDVSTSWNYEPENVTGYYYYAGKRSTPLSYSELYDVLSRPENYLPSLDEVDKSIPLPQLKFNELSGSTFFNFTNGTSDRTVDIRIKAYGPASIYFNSVSLNPLDRFLDKYEYAITSEISSNYFEYSDFLSNAYFVLNGFNANWQNNVEVIDIFNDFVPFCQLVQDNVEFEYANAWVAANCKTDSFLNSCLLLYNSAFYEMEGYARFVETDGSKVKVGPWQHFVIERGGHVSQSTNPDGLIELPDQDDDDRNNPDLSPVEPSVPDNLEDFDIETLWATVYSFVHAMSVIPNMISDIMSFLPSWLIFMISFGIAALVVLRIVGR